MLAHPLPSRAAWSVTACLGCCELVLTGLEMVRSKVAGVVTEDAGELCLPSRGKETYKKLSALATILPHPALPARVYSEKLCGISTGRYEFTRKCVLHLEHILSDVFLRL